MIRPVTETDTIPQDQILASRVQAGYNGNFNDSVAKTETTVSTAQNDEGK